MRTLSSGIYCILFTFLCFNLTAQNTPLGTPATQNPDGSTDTPGTPAACAAGFNIYSIDHEDEKIGFLPSGYCVTTDLLNNGTTPITVTGTPNGAGLGDVDNIVVDGGRINYSSTDGGDLDATYNFCSTVTNPYVFIGDLETFTTINFFDCNGNPVNINLMNGQSRFAVSGNSALITGTTSTNQDGYVQVPGSYDCLVININNPPPFTLDVIQVAVGVCMPDPPTGNMTCPYDLYLWKKDDYCVPVYRDAEGTFYEKDQNNNNIASLGDELFVNGPLCGTVEFLEANAIDDIACEPEFTCDAFPVEVEFYEPAGNGCLFSTYWYDQTSFSINDTDPGNQWSAIFSGTDAFGLPAHPGTPTTAAENCGLEWLGDNEGDMDFDDEAGGANEDEQLQLDGWLYVANHLECIQFRIGSSATDHSVALFLGADLNSMTLVTEENDNQAGAGNNTPGFVGSFCIPDEAVTTVDDCAWKVIRVRIYAHDDDTAYDPAVDWSFNGGLNWDVVEEQWFVAATSASDNTPPVGAPGGGGCNPITNCLIDADEVIVDEQGNVWPAGNCTSAPTNLYEPNVPNGGACFGDANAEEGDHFSLLPYCVRFNDEPSFTCTLCEIDIQVAGCACNNPDNNFADSCPQSVTEYEQTITINSETNNSYTVTGMGIVGGITTVDGVGEEQTFTFFVTPGTPYTITVVGDDTGVTQIFEGECEAPNDCNCPSAPEICGDGMDNDCDGLVDGADPDVVGDCILACTPDPVIIDGKDLCLDGFLTHQVWSRECGNTGCCASSINPHSCALAAFPCVDINGLPAHFNQCNSMPADPCNPPSPGPPGQAGCTGNDVFTLLGSTHNQAPQFYSTRPEQTQLDGWLVVPPGLTCFELKVNHPRAWDAQAVYMGAGVASMSLIGASSFPPQYSTDNEASCQADDGSNPTGDVFNFDVTTDGSTPVLVDGCTWYVVRVRAYIFDESWYHVTPVQWNFGNGFQTIPRKYFQSVGPDGWDTDNNMPTAANIIDAAPFCAYQDADGDLFDAQGDLIALDEFSCQQIGTSACLDCPPFYNEELCPGNVCVNNPETDDNGELVPVELQCDLFLYEITPQVIDEMASPGTGLLTRYWDHDQANCTSLQLENESIFCAFSGTNGAVGSCTANSTGDDACPTCLPSHPNFDNPTEADLITPTLGNTIHNQTANDADGDGNVLGAYNRRSGENVQQDGWLLVPPDVTCIGFRIYSLSWASGALYLGPAINDMTFVGEWINRSGNNSQDIFYFDVPTSAPTVSCVDCDTQDFRMLRVRTYTHDNNMFANTIWDWNVNGVWNQVPTAHLFPVPDHCSDQLPADICPTYTTGTPYIAIHEDSNGDGMIDAGDQWFASPWNNCDDARAGFDEMNPPSLVPIGLGACDEITDLSCPLCCELIVDCSNVVDSTLACIANLPPEDTNLPIIVDSCGAVTVVAETLTPGNTGCPNDTLYVTRSYFVEDSGGNRDTCMQTFTVISTMDPVFTFFPSDTTVECGASTDPAATGMATGEGECHPQSPQATVTFEDAITPGACPAEMTITRTWTVTDRCMRSVSMDQVIMVVDTVAPTMVCQNITIELDANGMATADPNAVDNGSSDNCGGPVTLSLSMDMFTCDDTGPNDVWLIGEDECGNMDSCMAVITVEDNIDPTITCPDNIVMPNDFGVCGAIVEYEVVADDNCGFSVMQTEGIPSGGFYPVGETTNCFTVTDDSGATAECCFTVTINDEEGPMVECPDDVTIQLESGECEEVLYYDIPFMDNCGTIDAEMSQAVNEALVSTALDCANNTSNHLRYFENTLPVPVEITQVNFGVFNSGVNETVTVNIYAIMPGAPFIYANMVLVGTTDQAVPAGMNQVILTAMVEATIPVGMNYVLELRANNTTNFVIGYNTAGETGSTFISGNPPVPCVSLEPVDIDILGFGAFAVVLYSNAEGGPFIEQTGGLPSGSYFPIGTTTNTFIATDVYGNETVCEFDVEVVEFMNGVTGVLACNDGVNVSLDENCEALIGADMILEGNVYGCFDDYDIAISGVAGNIVTEPGTYTVTVTDPDSGNSCWGTITVEGKALPTLDCTAALCPIDMLQGEWTEDDDTFSPGAAWAFDGFPPNNDILYDVLQFTVEVPGIYTLTMTPSPDFDGIAGIYADSFDPDMPALNLVGGDDDIPGVFESEPDFMINLDAGTYFLVSSTWGAGQMGVYTWSFSGPGDLLSNCDVKCYELDALLSGELEIPAPTVSSCIPFTLNYSDSVDNSDCGVTIVTRTYVAENANGTATCEVTFEIEPLSVALDVNLPETLVELTCNDGTDPDDIVAIFDNPLTLDDPNTSIIENNEGYVFAYPTYEVNGHPQKIDNNACNIYSTYSDQDIDACGVGCSGNKKVIRTWTILDWCTQQTTIHVQTIKAVDTEAPTLGTKDITLSTDPWGCSVDFDVPLPWELHDNCDSNPKYYVSGPAGVLITGSFETGYRVIGAPKGVHTFYYVAYDCCENEQSYPFIVTVIDDTPPVVAVTENIVISLTSSGTSGGGIAKLYAQSVDNGSHDGCSDVKLEVRRDQDICGIQGNNTYNADGHPQDGSPNPNSPAYDPDGGAFVKFCCEDISNATVDVNGDGELDAGYVKVWLRVWDDGDMDGQYGTAGDNYNEAWAFVKVEDKLNPTIQCPPDVTLTCDMDYTDLNMTGVATASGSCNDVEVEYNDIIVSLNACNEGFVRRRWNIVGRSDIFCDQTIAMEDLDQPVNVSFSQVQDFTAANCPDMITLGQPTWVAGPCDVIGYTLETDTFKFEDGACYKLVNHWTVINWCDYEPNDQQWDGEGLWEHVQVIKVTDETKPVIEDCEDKMFAINDHSDSDDDGEVCEAKIVLTNVATDEGSENCPTGWLKWQVFIDLWGDGTDDLEFSSFLPTFDTQFNDTNGNGIPDRYISPTASGGEISIPLPDIAGSMSNHKVRWKVTDGCNNVTSCSYDFMVVDKKAPTPYCVSLSTAVMENNGSVELWAVDFNIGSFDNCTAQENLRYTFTSTPPEEDPLYSEDLRSSSMVFDCDDVAAGEVEVNMYVWDEKGNADYCVVFLTIVDNVGACDETRPDVGGVVATETGLAVDQVEATLAANLPEYPRVEMTDVEGHYAFYSNPKNVNYTIAGSKDIDYMNGVSTLDLVKIQRHILGLEMLNSPYKLVAADVNADNAVKASDLLELRKLILGVIIDLPTNESWRFVDGEQSLTMDMDLEDVDYTQEVSNLQEDVMSKNFVAVKVGDVTEDATANFTNVTTVVRSGKTLELSIENQAVESGQTVSVGFTSEDFQNVFGYQFTMELNGLEFVGVTPGAVGMKEENVGVLSTNMVTMSYNSSTSVSAGNNEELFTVQFLATKTGDLANMIDITSKVTRSEAYTSESLDISTVALTKRGEITEYAATELYQNEPNPFVEQTVIGFNLAETAKATMTVFDVTGKVILKKAIDGVKGYNTLNLTAKQLGTSGVLYYTLESGEFTATKKMIVIE